jgi:hypothetical protein
VLAIRIFAAGVIASDERTGRESVLTANSSIAEDERKARAVLDAIGTGHGTRARRGRDGAPTPASPRAPRSAIRE